MRTVKLTLALLTVGFGLIQFFGPVPTNPPVDPSRSIRAQTSMPDEVARVLERSCYDCHSNETRWPWYGHVAPASWLVVEDVEEGRGRMNFSEWGGYTPRDAAALLTFVKWSIETGSMPLESYTIVHPGARLSEDEVRAVSAWVDAELARRNAS